MTQVIRAAIPRHNGRAGPSMGQTRQQAANFDFVFGCSVVSLSVSD